MGVKDFSSATQWAPLAKDAIKAADKRLKRSGGGQQLQRGAVQSLARVASPLRLNA